MGETVAYHVQSPLVHFLLWGPTLGAHKSPYDEPSALVEDTVQIQKKLFLSNWESINEIFAQQLLIPKQNNAKKMEMSESHLNLNSSDGCTIYLHTESVWAVIDMSGSHKA